jgi:hypothetical protein
MATRRVERFDRIDHAEELSAPRETPEGFLVVEAFVSRPGIYRYINTREDEAEGLGPEGAVRLELRPDSEVFSDKSISTYRSRSITVGHPRKAGKRVRVDASNVREFEVGTVDGSARRVGDKLAAQLSSRTRRRSPRPRRRSASCPRALCRARRPEGRRSEVRPVRRDPDGHRDQPSRARREGARR